MFTSFLTTQCSVTAELLKLGPSAKGIQTAFPLEHQGPPSFPQGSLGSS